MLLCIILFGVELLFVFQTLTHLLPDSPALYYLLSSSVGITFILFFVALVYDLMHTAAEHIPFQPERRRFIKIGFDLTMIIAAVSYLLDGLIGGLRRPMLRFETIALGEKETSYNFV